MNLKDIVDESGLQQDEWSLTRPRFGEEGQLEVVGWSGRGTDATKLYIVKCNKCSQDPELFGEGYFRNRKGGLERAGRIPCGCSRRPSWTLNQYLILCKRAAEAYGNTFNGIVGDWMGVYTNISQSCSKHGEWSSGTINNLVRKEGNSCPECRVVGVRETHTKPDKDMIISFLDSGAFHPDTKFWRSDRLNSNGHRAYWQVYCPGCGEQGSATSRSLQQGHRPCRCSKQRQRESYINFVMDENTTVAIKFGIARDSKQRVRQQNSRSGYKILQYAIFEFDMVESCKKAEWECKQQLFCGVLSKEEMSDGYTETTWVYNLEKIIEIYKRNGGTRVE